MQIGQFQNGTGENMHFVMKNIAVVFELLVSTQCTNKGASL